MPATIATDATQIHVYAAAAEGRAAVGKQLLAEWYPRINPLASAFLYWLESNRDQRIVHEISTAFEQGNFTPALFAQNCGKPLDALWDEFVVESQRPVSR